MVATSFSPGIKLHMLGVPRVYLGVPRVYLGAPGVPLVYLEPP